jgi:hypothetical protein
MYGATPPFPYYRGPPAPNLVTIHIERRPISLARVVIYIL